MKEEPEFIMGPEGRLEALVAGIGEGGSLEDANSNLPIGIVCHPHPLFEGSMHNKVVTTLVKAWQSLGFPTVRFNFRGVGKSEGNYAEAKGEVDDLHAIVQWVQKKKPNTSIALAGFSFGSYIAAKVAEELTSKTSIQKAFFQEIAMLFSIAPPVHHFAFDDLKPLCPWVIIQGTQDEVVPHNLVIDWYNAMSLKLEKPYHKLILMEDTTHFFHGRLNELKSEIIQETKIIAETMPGFPLSRE